MIDLEKIAKEYHAKITDEVEVKLSSITIKIILSVLSYYYERYKDDLVLFGGQTATPIFWGFKDMRKLTTDFDFVVSEKALPVIIEKEKLQFHSKWNTFFTYYEDVVCCFSCYHIHDWKIPKDFFNSASFFSLKGKKIKVCSREYTIALKLRRALQNNKIFGKDALDIINLVAAPRFRTELSELDYEKIAKLCIQYVGKGVIDFFPDIIRHVDNVEAHHKLAAREELIKLSDYIKEYKL